MNFKTDTQTQSINQSIIQSINRSTINQSTNQPTNQSMDQSIEQSINGTSTNSRPYHRECVILRAASPQNVIDQDPLDVEGESMLCQEKFAPFADGQRRHHRRVQNDGVIGIPQVHLQVGLFPAVDRDTQEIVEKKLSMLPGVHRWTVWSPDWAEVKGGNGDGQFEPLDTTAVGVQLLRQQSVKRNLHHIIKPKKTNEKTMDFFWTIGKQQEKTQKKEKSKRKSGENGKTQERTKKSGKNGKGRREKRKTASNQQKNGQKTFFRKKTRTPFTLWSIPIFPTHIFYIFHALSAHFCSSFSRCGIHFWKMFKDRLRVISCMAHQFTTTKKMPQTTHFTKASHDILLVSNGRLSLCHFAKRPRNSIYPSLLLKYLPLISAREQKPQDTQRGILV